jgi:hypothetical protein
MLGICLICGLSGREAGGQAPTPDLVLPTIADPAFAAGEGPVVLMDEGHFNAHIAEGSDRPFMEFLRRDGYRVSRLATLDRDSLDAAQVLVIPMPLAERNRIRGNADTFFDPQLTDFDLPNPSAFSREEIATIVDWVAEGGALLLMADHMPVAGAVSDLAAAFGLHVRNGHAGEPSGGWGGMFRRSEGLLHEHPIARGRSESERVDSIKTMGGSAFSAAADVEPLMVLPEFIVSREPTRFRRFTADTPTVPVGGWFQGVAQRRGRGRVVFLAEAGMFFGHLSSYTVCRDEEVCQVDPAANQNPQFLLNTMHWLSGLLDTR